MKRRLWLIALMGIYSVAAGSTVGQQSSPVRQFKASGQHASFEWFFLPVEMGEARGLWAGNGLDPEFVPAAASAVQLKQQIEAGVKIGLVNTAEVLLARSQGAPVRIVAGYFGATIAKIFVRADAPMKTAQDLDGKKIGILSETHTSARAVLYMNQQLGIKAEPVALGNLANNTAALRAGTVDAFYSSEGAALALVDSGELKILVPLADVYPRPYTAAVIWATDDLIERHPDLVKSFVKTILESVRALKEHPDQAIGLFIKQTNAPQSLAARAVAELNNFLTSGGRGSGQDLVAAVAGNWQFTKDSGAIPAGTNVNINEAVDAEFLPEQGF